MLGIVYLILSGLVGYKITEGLLLQKSTAGVPGINRIWLVFPVSFGVGTLLMTWAVYVVSWLASVCAGAKNPLFYGNLAGLGLAVLILWALFYKNLKKKGRQEPEPVQEICLWYRIKDC